MHLLLMGPNSVLIQDVGKFASDFIERVLGQECHCQRGSSARNEVRNAKCQ